jgi:hypothetical protein
MYGAFVWARGALNGRKRRFPARAGREWRAGSFGGNAGECVQDVGIGETSGWGEEWSGNTCIFGGSAAHPSAATSIGDFGAKPHLLTAGKNTYLVPAGTNVTLDFTPGQGGPPRMTLAQVCRPSPTPTPVRLTGPRFGSLNGIARVLCVCVWGGGSVRLPAPRAVGVDVKFVLTPPCAFVFLVKG